VSATLLPEPETPPMSSRSMRRKASARRARKR
jgi:hypothetical protein